MKLLNYSWCFIFEKPVNSAESSNYNNSTLKSMMSDDCSWPNSRHLRFSLLSKMHLKKDDLKNLNVKRTIKHHIAVSILSFPCKKMNETKVNVRLVFWLSGRRALDCCVSPVLGKKRCSGLVLLSLFGDTLSLCCLFCDRCGNRYTVMLVFRCKTGDDMKQFCALSLVARISFGNLYEPGNPKSCLTLTTQTKINTNIVIFMDFNERPPNYALFSFFDYG